MTDELTNQPQEQAPGPEAEPTNEVSGAGAPIQSPGPGARDAGPDRGRRGGRPTGFGRGERPRRGAGPGSEEGGFDDVVVRVYRCATVVKGGRRFSFSALVVAGDRRGRVGVGYGKANEVPSAVEKANKAARRNMITVKLAGTTLPHQVMAKYRASKVLLVPASAGTGVIAGASVRAVMELAGVKDVLTKAYGSTSPKNLVKAAFLALNSLRSKDEVAKLRAVSLA